MNTFAARRTIAVCVPDMIACDHFLSSGRITLSAFHMSLDEAQPETEEQYYKIKTLLAEARHSLNAWSSTWPTPRRTLDVLLSSKSFGVGVMLL